jgi:HAD superfamily hydrolase (TIGR01509 family)
MKYKALLCDLDGTLIDSERIWHEQSVDFYRSMILAFDPIDQKSLAGKSMKGSHAFLQEHYGLDLSYEDFLQRNHDMAIEKIYKKCELLPGVRDFLERHTGKIPMAIASSSPHLWIDVVLERLDLAQYFQAVVSADDVEGRGKPLPDIFLLAALELGAEPVDCLVLEDTDNGVRAAKAARMEVWAIRNGFNDVQGLAEADKIFMGFEGLEV